MERTEIEEAHLEILSDVLGISVAELCPEDKLNYHVPLLYVLEAMEIVTEQSGWISVKEQKPELETVALVYAQNDYIQTAYIEASTKLWVGIGNYRQPKVTHWQPLPCKP